jgi:hypothetical protein
MNTLATPVVPATATVRTVVADPDETPDFSGVEPGGILVFTNRSHKYPTFEIQFLDDNPASPGDILIGSTAVVVHVDKTGTFDYRIRHMQPHGKDRITGTFSVRSCSGC